MDTRNQSAHGANRSKYRQALFCNCQPLVLLDCGTQEDPKKHKRILGLIQLFAREPSASPGFPKTLDVHSVLFHEDGTTSGYLQQSRLQFEVDVLRKRDGVLDNLRILAGNILDTASDNDLFFFPPGTIFLRYLSCSVVWTVPGRHIRTHP